MQLMMKKIKAACFTTSLILMFVISPFQSSAQDEIISPLESNMIKSIYTSSGIQEKMQSTDTLFLPFFDDFSSFTVWPSSERWSDSTVFVNPNFGINPPTIGVATFDGLDSRGQAYNNSNVNAAGPCDLLTSKPINLFNDANGIPYSSSDSIFLVFYFQRKGRGDNPESNDSLQLQFLNSQTQQWQWVWSASGITGGDTLFAKVKISIIDPSFRQNGFKFRFRSFGSQTGMLDIWNVDYVHLNRFLPPDYDVIRDYSFVYQGTSLLNNYSAVPWKHFVSLSSSQQQSFVKPSANLTLRNNNDASPFPIKVAGTVYDRFGTATPIIGGGGLNNIVIPLNSNVTPPATLLTNTFIVDATADNQTVFSALYDIGSTSGGVVDDFPVNDTLRYNQHFYDYYSYDDGSAELAYGVSGVGAQLAYKFDLIKADTLRAVHMFFAQSGLDVSSQPFRLAVWSGTVSGPSGAPVYQKFNQSPNYLDSINGFYTYLTDPVALTAGTWFFGYIQTNAAILNLGLDVNTPADNTRKFINTSGSWVNSQLPGMWMIRPVLSENPLFTSTLTPKPLPDFSVFPVPSDGVVHIRLSVVNHRNYLVSVHDQSGRVVMTFPDFMESIDISSLSSGFYFIRLTDSTTGESSTRKLIKTGH